MKHLNAEKYNLAWFKLAECVSRKEKERALGVYRLLSHSLDNDALAVQLSGDLFLCFDDHQKAIEKYLQAAELYKKNNQFIESIAVYEHIIVLQPGTERHVFDLCQLYVDSDMSFKVVDHVDRLIKKKSFDVASKIIKKMDVSLKPQEVAKANQDLLFALLKHEVVPKEKVMQHIEKIIDGWSEVADDYMLQDFLHQLRTLHKDFYEHAVEYLEKDTFTASM